MKKFVLSLGGSIVMPGEVDVEFIKKFKNLIFKQLDKKKFYIIIGGGRLARNYQKAAKSIGKIKSRDLDLIGISATRLNAYLLKSVFGKYAFQDIIYDPNKLPKANKKIFLSGGSKPGWSTDYVATVIAKNLGVKTVINLSNIDYIYDKDPNKFSDAKPIKKIAWKEFKKIVGNKWIPGANLPFDPVACKLAEKKKMRVVIMNGKKLKNLEKFLEGESFVGSVIE